MPPPHRSQLLRPGEAPLAQPAARPPHPRLARLPDRSPPSFSSSFSSSFFFSFTFQLLLSLQEIAWKKFQKDLRLVLNVDTISKVISQSTVLQVMQVLIPFLSLSFSFLMICCDRRLLVVAPSRRRSRPRFVALSSAPSCSPRFSSSCSSSSSSSSSYFVLCIDSIIMLPCSITRLRTPSRTLTSS